MLQFMHTGAVFDQPDDFTNQQIDLNSTRMKEFMPKAIRRFEDHLVELDMQVVDPPSHYGRPPADR